MNPQMQQALQMLKQKRDQMMGNVKNDFSMMTDPSRQEEADKMGMNMAMKMITGGVTMPATGPSLNNPALYGQRDQIGRILNPKTIQYLQEGVMKGGNTINDFGQLSKVAGLIEKGKDTPNNLRTAMELLKVLGLMK